MTFVVPRMLRFKHLQTVSSALPWRDRLPAHVTHEHLDLPIDVDKPELGVLVTRATWQPQPAPCVVVLHGVAGGSEDAYVVRAAHVLVRAGFSVVRVNLRGSGLGSGKAAGLYHAALTDDVRVVLQWLAPQERATSLGLLGFSLGGHVSLRTVGELGEKDAGKLRAVATISSPLDLAVASEHFARSGVHRFYEKLIVGNLRRHSRALKLREGDRLTMTLRQVDRIKNVNDFDDLVTFPHNGFTSAADFHARASAGPLLARIRVPTLVIHSEDDPIVAAASVHAWEHTAPAQVRMLWTEHGGHVGFVDGLAQMRSASWAVARALEFLQSHLFTHA